MVATAASPYDWSSFERPMGRAEARELRKTLRGGKSYFRFMEIEQFAGLIVLGGIALFMIVPAAVVLPISVVSSFHLVKTPGEALGAVGLGLVLPIVLFAAVYFGIRALIIPPRWRAWARMARFAHDNRITFIIEEPMQIPGTLIPSRNSIAPSRLYGAFRDDGRKITLGDYVLPARTPRGIGSWRGVIIVEPGLQLGEGLLGAGQVSALIGDTAGNWNVELEVAGDVVVAVKSLPFFTRRPAALRRAFDIAVAIQSNSRSLVSR